MCRYTGFPSKDTLTWVFDILNEAEINLNIGKVPIALNVKGIKNRIMLRTRKTMHITDV